MCVSIKKGIKSDTQNRKKGIKTAIQFLEKGIKSER